jgi:hypothetical protein
LRIAAGSNGLALGWNAEAKVRNCWSSGQPLDGANELARVIA